MLTPLGYPATSVRRVVPIALALLLLGMPTAAGAAAGPEASKATQELAKAQRKANEAADRLSKAEAALARADGQLQRARTAVAESEGQVAAAGEQVRQLAVLRYVGGTADNWRLLNMGDANESAIARVLTDVAVGEKASSIGRLRAEREDLDSSLGALEASERSNAAAVAELRRQRAAAAAEVERLGRRAKEIEAEAAREAAAAKAKATPAAAPAAAPAAGAASTPAAAAAAASPSVGGASWVCPVQGSRAFSDDYGDPRPGGNSHDGNDILAPRGTPVVANVAGNLSRNTSSRGGLSYYLRGDDGNTYFGAHLDAYADAQGRVTAGTQIGTVGTTGDASGGPPHLHFEIHPGGGRSVNPYPTLTRYC